MRRSRRLLSGILVFAALALAVPAATLASGGGSAGDQQYTDPFAGTPTPTTTHTTAAPATTPAPVASPPTTSTPATAPATAASATSPSSATPSATTAAPARPTELPFTGYDSWLAAGLGAAMVTGGLMLRRRARRA